MPSNGNQLFQKLTEAAESIERIERETVEVSSLYAKEELTDAVRYMAGADQRISNVGKRGARVSVRYDLGHTPEGFASRVYAVGPLQIVENRTSAHTIPKRTKRGKIRKGKKRLTTPYGTFTSVDHPGTSGKHKFKQAMDYVLRQIDRRMIDEAKEVIRRGTR